jgi:hypothetical protein
MAVPDYSITASFRDSKSKIATVTFYSNALTDAAARTQAQDLRLLLQAMSPAVVSKVSLNINIWESPNVPLTACDVEEKMTFNARDTFAFLTAVSIPAFLESLVLPNTDRADLDAVAVAEFVSEWLGGAYVSSHDDDLVTLASTKKSWK